MVKNFRIRIRKHEVGLRFRHGDFVGPLQPGAYVLPGRLLGIDRVDVRSTLEAKFEHPMLDVLIENAALQERLVVADLDDNQRALVWKDGRLGWVLGPGRYAFWNRPGSIRVETFDVDALRFTHAKVEAVLAHPAASRYFEAVRVEDAERLLVFRDGGLVEQVGAGLHVFWKQAGRVTWKAIDLREQVADVAGQEIMTADKVTLRVNLVVTYQVVDPVKAVSVVADSAQALYREAQLVLRAAVGGRQLDALLADKESVGGEVKNALAQRASEFGVVVRSVGLRDVVLPGDMKTILNQVIEAQKQAEANLIRRREETAAARSQANTAKLLSENPALARMKELEALQEILRGTKANFIFGAGSLPEQVRQLITSDA
jgi:regulator of protease activity HflC (stomatin/prohibitin superfamily)